MGNFITDTLGKIASNVTQSVISALIVTAVTTYLIVSPGKKNEAKETAAKDSANSTTIAAPVEKPDHAGQAGELGQQSTDTATPENVGAGKNMNAAGMTTPAVVPATEKKVPSAQSQSPVNAAATKAYKELSSPETSAEQKLERTITEGRAKGDSLANANPHDDKAKDIKKEEKKQTKDVKKRADEVFDELDQETQK